MSYNISSWKTKELKDFQLPLDALYADDRGYLDRPEIMPDRTTSIEGMDGTVIKGKLIDNQLIISSITCYGEGSGTTYDILLISFRSSMGTLIAVCVWEGGDSISRLTVQNGTITEEQIEL